MGRRRIGSDRSGTASLVKSHVHSEIPIELVYPILNVPSHLFQMTVEKMVRALNHDQRFRIGERPHSLLQFLSRCELIPRAADEKFRFRAPFQESEVITSLFPLSTG